MGKDTATFYPDYNVYPGEILEEYLDSYNMSQKELATRTGLTPKTINEIIKAKAPITPETAVRLERVFGRPAHFWNNLEQNYQEQKIRLEKQGQLEKSKGWLKKVPVVEMIERGWIKRCENDIEQYEAILSFFGVDSPEAQERIWETHQVANFRESYRFQKNQLSISAWLRRGEILAQGIDCVPYNKKRFSDILHQARAMTSESDFQSIIHSLEEICARAGVAFLIVPELKQTHVWGATRWIRGKNKAIMQLSCRYKSNDHFWFTFFHEAFHILEHGKSSVFIESNTVHSEQEKEADIFASNFLIPPDKMKDFLGHWDGQSLEPIRIFAQQIGIATGIVIGRLQHDNRLSHQNGNKLKIFYA